MWIFRLVVANLIAGILRPLVWAALRVLAVLFVVSVPARLWVLYVDPRPSAETLAVLEWGTGFAVVGGWLFLTLFPCPWRPTQGRHVSRGSVQRRA